MSVRVRDKYKEIAKFNQDVSDYTLGRLNVEYYNEHKELKQKSLKIKIIQSYTIMGDQYHDVKLETPTRLWYQVDDNGLYIGPPYKQTYFRIGPRGGIQVYFQSLPKHDIRYATWEQHILDKTATVLQIDRDQKFVNPVWKNLLRY